MNTSTFFNLIRYKSYLKNLLIFSPLFFNYTIWNIIDFSNLLLAIIFFSFLTSAVYIINDLFDLDVDKNHIKKKFRPIASGKVSKQKAILIALIFAAISIMYFFLFTSQNVLILILSYLLINLLYSFVFKKIKYLDILIVSSGFLIRIFIGSIMTSLTISYFYALQIFLFALFILACKRREYFFSFQNKIISNYSLKELNNICKILFILNILNYFIYLFDDLKFINSFSLEISFVIFFILINRYLLINFNNKQFDPISIYFNDKYLFILSLIYVVNFFLGFYDFY